MTFECPFTFGDKVHIDGDDSIKATVTGFCFREKGYDVEVSWIANAAMQTVWVAEYRLSKPKARCIPLNPPPPVEDVGGLARRGI